MRRRAVLAGALGLSVVLAVGPVTPQARAAEPEPTPAPTRSSATTERCGGAPSILGAVCDAVDATVEWGLDSLVMGGSRAAMGQVVGFVVDGAAWLLDKVATLIDRSTRPDVRADWFGAAYRDMAAIALLGILPFLLLAVIQALVRQHAGGLLRAAFVHLPLAAIGTAGAVVVVDLLVRLTDSMSAWVGRSFGNDLSTFATEVGSALAVMGMDGAGVASFAGLIAAAVIAFAAFVVWLELLLRQAAIYVAVLFLPLGFMALVWPATAHWLKRLVHGLVAIILSKFVIVAIMAMAASALGASTEDDGFSVVVSGGALLSLAALAPYVLLRIIPVFEAGLTTDLEGTLRRPTSAVGPPRSTTVTHLMRQRMASGGGRAGPVEGGAVAAGSVGGGAATAGAGAAASTAGAAARAATGVADRTSEVATQPAQGRSGPPRKPAVEQRPPVRPTQDEETSDGA